MKKAISLLMVLVSAMAFSSCGSLHFGGIRIDKKHFPDTGLWNAVRGFDSNRNGYLNSKEIEEAKSIVIWDECSDLSGIEYLPNLETVIVAHCQCSDLSGVKDLTNLKTLSFQDHCPDLSGLEDLTNLEELSLYQCVFNETYVFDNESSVIDLKFKTCVFEQGITFRNAHVENVTFEYCALGGDVDFSDCDGLINFEADFDPNADALFNDLYDDGYDHDYFDALSEQSYNVDLSGCDNLDYARIKNGQVINSVDLSDCSVLRVISLSDLYYYGEEAINEATLNISGSPNIEYAHINLWGINELDISDCPHLISATEQTPSGGDSHIEYESEDGYLYSLNELVVIIK